VLSINISFIDINASFWIVTSPVVYKGFLSLWKGAGDGSPDIPILLMIARGEFNITGFRNKHLRKLPGLKATKISRLIK
jgi:hypothetical protein